MLRIILSLAGLIVAMTPKKILKLLCCIAGDLAYVSMFKRRRIALSNLHHAFPAKTEDWRRGIARTSFRRMIELGALSACSGWLTVKRIKRDIRLSKNFKKTIDNIQKAGTGAVVILPHVAMMESATFLPLLLENPTLNVCVIYRPFGSKHLEQWILKTRQRFGLKMLARSKGFLQAKETLANKGMVALLFDQHAGVGGARVAFMGRLCSTTDLPVSLAKHFNSPIYMIYPRRTDFFEAELEIDHIPQNSTPSKMVCKANEILAKRLTSNDAMCSDCLWMHHRWKINFDDKKLLGEEWRKKDWFTESLQYSGNFDLHQFRVIVRMPNWLGDVCMTIPLLRAIKKSRPDITLTLLCQNQYVDILSETNIADDIIALPPKSDHFYFWNLRKLRLQYFDLHIVLTNSLRSDIEAYLIGAEKRIGIERKYKRKLLTNTFKLASNFDENSIHQTRLWEMFLKNFGLYKDIDTTPVILESLAEGIVDKKAKTIGIVCGSENCLEKQWPPSSWKILIELLLNEYKDVNIRIYGTNKNIKFAEKICVGFPKTHVINLAGKTTVMQFIQNLSEDSLVISIDTGGLHLANMIGVQTVAIFGPTNSARTGPIFNSKCTIVRPPCCPVKGGAAIDDIDAIELFEVIHNTYDG